MYGNRLLSDFTEKVRIRQVENELRHKGCERIIVYLWRPEFERALDFARHDMSCYHIDDEYTFSDKEEPIRDSEDRVIRRVDQVIIHSRALMEKKGKINPNTFFVPNGVDFKSYATPREEPGDLKPISRPRVGYVGIIKKQLDLPLLVTLARNHKDFSFVFVGPVGKVSGVEKSLSDLQGMPNVHFLGGKPVEALPAYVQHMDVCMLCYDLTGYTKFIYPMKLHEYLACGSPVIGTPIDSLREFSDVIHLARTPEEWSHALDKALSPEERSPERLARRVRVAKEHDWDGLVRSIAGKLYGRLGEQIDVRRAVHGSTKTDP